MHPFTQIFFKINIFPSVVFIPWIQFQQITMLEEETYYLSTSRYTCLNQLMAIIFYLIDDNEHLLKNWCSACRSNNYLTLPYQISLFIDSNWQKDISPLLLREFFKFIKDHWICDVSQLLLSYTFSCIISHTSW